MAMAGGMLKTISGTRKKDVEKIEEDESFEDIQLIQLVSKK